MNGTRLEYHGLVELIHKTKKGKISNIRVYNAGTTNLFEAFARAMAGLNIKGFLPASIGIGSSGQFTKAIPITGLTFVNDVESSSHPATKMTVVIPYTEGMQSFNQLQLKSANDQILATVNITNAPSVAEGQSILVNWYLYITNPSE